MVCHSQEPKKVKSIKELSEVNHRTLVRVVKPIGVVLLLTEQVTVCSTLYLVGLLATIVFSSSNILHLTSLWREQSVEVLWLITWPMEPSTG